jgi:HJR/Mrr/RecB family endonuclease
MVKIKKDSAVDFILLLFVLCLLGLLLLPFISLVLGIYFIIKYFKSRNEKIYFENIEKMSPYAFEHFIAKIFRKMGYKALVTKPSRDFGVDVIAKNNEETIAIQVKKFNDHPIGNRDVQMLLGAMQMKKFRADRSIIITTSRFTKSAFEQADGCPIELWDRKKLKKIIKKFS